MAESAVQFKLVIELRNTEPLELAEMADCFKSTGAEYRRYVAENQGLAASEDVRLYVKEVRPGSTIVEVFAACASVFPTVLEYGKSVIGFVGELLKIIKFLKNE